MSLECGGGEPPWAVPLVVLCGANAAAVVLFEAYVLYKSRGGRRHLFLGQALLLGLLLASLLGFAFAAPPSPLACALRRAGPGAAGALVYAALLVKGVFLLSLHAGAPLGAPYQALLLGFSVAVQLAPAAQWLAYRPPGRCCGGASGEVSASLAYPLLLMCGAAWLGWRARAFPENHGEGRRIGAAAALSLPPWAAWALWAAVDGGGGEAALAFVVSGTAAVVFGVVLLPKVRQLSSMGRLVSAASEASVCTPSFLHLKPPLKQGKAPFLAPAAPRHGVDRGYFVPPLRLAAWGPPRGPRLLPPLLHPGADDPFLGPDRFLFGPPPPGFKVYRSPLY